VTRAPKLAVWKFSSCDGCQLSLLHCEDELLAIADAVQIAYFLEASSAIARGTYDISLVEGSITTHDEVERIKEVRRRSKLLVTIGACATAGGIQALRNAADVDEWASLVYASPRHLDTLATSTPIADHVRVDYALQGCPVSKGQLLELLTALLAGRRPLLPEASVCMECKARGTTCLLVGRGTACLGPVTRAGCGALCPAFDRGCFGCFGPKEEPNTAALAARLRAVGASEGELHRLFNSYAGNAPAFREEALSHAE
jgi:coenzyme F420-reducing hydrogenase gamma subunit